MFSTGTFGSAQGFPSEIAVSLPWPRWWRSIAPNSLSRTSTERWTMELQRKRFLKQLPISLFIRDGRPRCRRYSWQKKNLRRADVDATDSKHFHPSCGKLCGQRAIKHTKFLKLLDFQQSAHSSGSDAKSSEALTCIRETRSAHGKGYGSFHNPHHCCLQCFLLSVCHTSATRQRRRQNDRNGTRT
jgi:hypothetical protein